MIKKLIIGENIMLNIYSREYELRTSDFDCNKRLLPSAVLDAFQVVAGEHAALLNCGIELLSQKNLLWVLVRTKYEVIAQPSLFQKVILKTWPLPPSRIGFTREYLMQDVNDNTLIKASSDWVIIDSQTRKIVSANNVYPEGLEYHTVQNFEKRLSKISNFESDGIPYLVTPGFSQLDMNGHVNNIKYANYAIDALDFAEISQIKAFQIDYRHEVKMGDVLKIYKAVREGQTLIKGEDNSNNVMFSCKIEF